MGPTLRLPTTPRQVACTSDVSAVVVMCPAEWLVTLRFSPARTIEMMSVGLSKVRVATTLSELRTQVSEIPVTAPGPSVRFVVVVMEWGSAVVAGPLAELTVVEVVGREVWAVGALVTLEACPELAAVVLRAVAERVPVSLATIDRTAQVTRAAITLMIPSAPTADMARMPPSPLLPGGRWRPPLGAPDTVVRIAPPRGRGAVATDADAGTGLAPRAAGG